MPCKHTKAHNRRKHKRIVVLMCWLICAACTWFSGTLPGKSFRTAFADYQVAFKIKMLYPSLDPTSFVFTLNNRRVAHAGWRAGKP